jgi:hypothetical protein
MNAAQNLDDILEEGVDALDSSWDEVEKIRDASGQIALPLPADNASDPCTGIRRVLVPEAREVPTWDDVTNVDPRVKEYSSFFEEGVRAGIQDVTEYRYRTAPPPSHFTMVAYHQKQGELSGERLQKYVDGFVEGAQSKLVRRPRWAPHTARASSSARR